MVRARTQELVLDFVGVALRGSRAQSSAPVQTVAQRFGPERGASLIGRDAFASAPWAGLANAASAHALELDDVTARSSLHPGVVVIPTALAVGEELHRSPTRVLEAIVAGYEVIIRVGDALNAESAYRRGFHPTGVAGAFGAAIAAGRLLDLDVAAFAIVSVSIKPYACCRYNHGLIDGVLQLQRAHGIRPQDVERIRLGVLSGGALLVAEPIDEKRAPRNVVDAQFSAPFAAAVALARGSAGLNDYTQANVDDPLIRGLMSRTDCHRGADLDAAYPDHWPATVEMRLRDGRELSVRIPDPTGDPANPVGSRELRDKFQELAGAVIGHEAALELAGRCLEFEAELDLDRFTALLRC